MNEVIITGHPYAFPYYFRVFEYAENKSNFIFALPELWLAKNGKIRIKLEQRPGLKIFGLRAVSYGGHGFRGLFKGWLPGLIFLLPYLKIKYKSKVLYSCSEPYLLTTLFNGLIAKFCGMKYVFFTWQNVDPKKYLNGLKLRIYLALIRFNLYLADGVICGNRKAAEIVKRLVFRHKNLEILICPVSGIDIEKFRPGIISNWRGKLNIAPEEKLILFYGALDRRKGLNVLIDAFKIQNTKYKTPNTKLVIVGTGPEQNNLKSQIANLKLQDKVKFLDWLPNDELPALINAADIFVYPSVPTSGWEEQFGYAMAEASACGVPVIATKTGSIDEVVIDGQSGILVKPNDPEQLSDALVRFLSNYDLRLQIGEFGREYIVKNFSFQVIADKIHSFLKGFTI